ncbi:MAG: hypothetical protein ACC645_06715 [Pirellulales bacterium]
MSSRLMIRPVVTFAAIALLCASGSAIADNVHRQARGLSQWYPWHGQYYHAGWGAPVALVVPPTVSYETNWGWGVGNTRVSRINHQFTRPYPGPYFGSGGFAPTPTWPSDTRQFGVYYARGPW